MLVDWNECGLLKDIFPFSPQLSKFDILSFEQAKREYLLDWTADLYDGESTYMFVDRKSKQVVSELVLIHECGYWLIDNFECRWKSKGYGTAVINELKYLAKIAGVSKLVGYSVPEAENFWLKMGAEFTGECAVESSLSEFIIKL